MRISQGFWESCFFVRYFKRTQCGLKMYYNPWLKTIIRKGNKSFNELPVMTLNIKWLTLQGLWGSDDQSATGRTRLQYLYPRIVLILAIVDSLVTQVGDIIVHVGNVEFVCENLVVLFMYGVINSSIATLLTHEEGLRDLLTRMKKLNEPDRLRNDDETRDIKKCQKLCNLFTLFGMIGGPLMFLSYLAAFHIARSYGLVPRDLIYLRGWYIFDLSKSPAFELTMIYRTVMMGVALYGLFASDTVLFIIMVHTVKQYEILGKRLRNLRAEAEKSVEKSRLFESRIRGLDSGLGNLELQILNREIRFQSEEQSENNLFNEMKLILGECVSRHIELNRFVKKFTSIYNVRLSYHVLLCLTGSCVTALFVLIANGNGVTKVAFCLLALSQTIWMLVFGILASRAVDESSRLSDALYSSDWLAAPKTFKRSMLIMMTASNQPIAFLVMGFVPLSVETFAAVEKTAFSYFRVLANLVLTQK